MFFDFTCPSCGKITEAQNDWEGMQAECPNCGKNVTIKRQLTIKRPAAVSAGPPESSEIQARSTSHAQRKSSVKSSNSYVVFGLGWAKIVLRFFILAALCVTGFFIYSYFSALKMREALTNDLKNGEDKEILLEMSKKLASRGWGNDVFHYRQLKASFLVEKPGCYQVKDGKAVPIDGVNFKVTGCTWGRSPNTVKIENISPSNIWISLLIINNKLMPFNIRRDNFIYRTDSNSCQWGQAVVKKGVEKSIELARSEGMKISISIGFSYFPPRTLEFNNGEYVFRAAILEHYLMDDFQHTAFGKPGPKGAEIFPMNKALEECFISPASIKKENMAKWNYPLPPQNGPKTIPVH